MNWKKKKEKNLRAWRSSAGSLINYWSRLGKLSVTHRSAEGHASHIKGIQTKSKEMLNVHRKGTLRFPASWDDLNMGADQRVYLARDYAEGFFFEASHEWNTSSAFSQPPVMRASLQFPFYMTKKKVLYFFRGPFLTSLCSLEQNLSHTVALDKCIQAYEALLKDSSDPYSFHRGCSDSRQGGRVDRCASLVSGLSLMGRPWLMFKVACVASRRDQQDVPKYGRRGLGLECDSEHAQQDSDINLVNVTWHHHVNSRSSSL